MDVSSGLPSPPESATSDYAPEAKFSTKPALSVSAAANAAAIALLSKPNHHIRIKAEPGSPSAAAAESTRAFSDSTSISDEEAYSSRTGRYLEDLSRTVLDVTLNQKAVSHPLLVKHLSTAFRSKHDALPRAASRGEHEAHITAHLANQPSFHVEVLNSSSEVDESRGRATVYLWYGISGVDVGRFEREAVAVLAWERRQGLWQIIKHTGMRGPSGFC